MCLVFPHIGYPPGSGTPGLIASCAGCADLAATRHQAVTGTTDVLLGSCHRSMGLKESVHMAQRLGNLLLGFLPGVDAHFGIRRETR